jgi:hypothetical protein
MLLFSKVDKAKHPTVSPNVTNVHLLGKALCRKDGDASFIYAGYGVTGARRIMLKESGVIDDGKPISDYSPRAVVDMVAGMIVGIEIFKLCWWGGRCVD